METDVTMLLVGIVVGLMAVLTIGGRGSDRTVIVTLPEQGQSYTNGSGCLLAILVAIVIVVVVLLGTPSP